MVRGVSNVREEGRRVVRDESFESGCRLGRGRRRSERVLREFHRSDFAQRAPVSKSENEKETSPARLGAGADIQNCRVRSQAELKIQPAAERAFHVRVPPSVLRENVKRETRREQLKVQNVLQEDEEKRRREQQHHQ